MAFKKNNNGETTVKMPESEHFEHYKKRGEFQNAKT